MTITHLTAAANATEELTDIDDVLSVYYAVQAQKQAVKEAEGKVWERMQTLIAALPDQEYAVGDVRFYIGTEKKVKCLSIPATIDALYTAAAQADNGDTSRALDCLSANAIKYGAARKLLGDEVYKSHFVEIKEEELKEGVPTRVKKLMKVDTSFVK